MLLDQVTAGCAGADRSRWRPEVRGGRFQVVSARSRLADRDMVVFVLAFERWLDDGVRWTKACCR